MWHCEVLYFVANAVEEPATFTLRTTQ